MFSLKDKFISFDNNFQPYTFSVERHTETANLHAGVTADGFALKSIGNRFILNTPKFQNGKFDMNFKISYMKEKDPCFVIIFSYDEKSRKGNGLKITYHIGKNISALPVTVDGCEYAPVSKEVLLDTVISENEASSLSFELNKGKARLYINGKDVTFDVAETEGRLAIDRENFIGELIICDFSFSSEDEFESERICEISEIKIPLVNGGDIPYTVSYAIDRISDGYYMSFTLDGGTRGRKVDKSARVGQYVAEIDWLDCPYVGLIGEKKDCFFNVFDGERCFVDPNIYWDCQKEFFGDTELPITASYKLKNFTPESLKGFVFGYKKLSCRGYSQQEGGSEFRFSTDGELIYGGMPINGNDIWELKSPYDKKATRLIPSDAYARSAVIEHLEKNHYFSVDEEINFELLYRTELETEYFTFKAEIKDVFEEEVLYSSDVNTKTSRFEKNYRQISASAHFPRLKVGVYKIVYTVYYGSDVHKVISFAFEVYDENSELCPPLESGLPVMFIMNNEQKNLERNGFDILTPMPSCDFGHYIACATNTPVEAEKLQIWKYMRTFGRKWFAWLAIRTCNDYLSPVHDVTIENADFLFHTGFDTDCDPLGAYSLFPNRIDYFAQSFFNYPGVRVLINEFFAEHKEYAERISYDATCEKIDKDMWKSISHTCGQELIDYINGYYSEYIRRHNRELERKNPNVKRAIYGPFAPYFAPTLTYHSLRYFGFPDDDTLCKEYYNGFAVFEDYPFSCSYQTYRGAFAAMSLLLHIPELRLYPELYVGSRGGCIDGAVKNAHAPMGDYDCPPYQNSTLAFEYVYNTAYRSKDGYSYWNKYGFHRGNCSCEYINEFVHNWRYVNKYKPKKPLRSIAYVVDYSRSEDTFEDDFNYYNQSEGGQTVLHECVRESGVPNGFGIKAETLGALDASECDVLVLPAVSGLDKNAVNEIRRLYDEGVNLIAVSDVTGLEDIFGVEYAPVKAVVSSVEYDGVCEYVYNRAGEFAYKPTKARVTATANGSLPAVIATDRTALINTALINLGSAESEKIGVFKGAYITGENIRKALKDTVASLSSPLAFGDNVGVTLFETSDGRRMLLAIDYTPFDNVKHNMREAVIKLNMDDACGASADIPLKTVFANGRLCEIRFEIKPHGFAFIELCTE